MQNTENENFKAELQISTQLPVITGNMDEIKTELAIQLKQFDLIVDEDSVKIAKAMATKINKLSEKIKTIRIAKTKELMAPIKAFEKQANELTSLCQESRQKLLSQLKVFDDKVKAECLILLEKERDILYSKYEIKDEFKAVKVDDLAIVSNKNKNSLAKKAKDAIEERVYGCKQLQDKINSRLMTLTGTCLERGLEAPLTLENVNHFLYMESDEKYENKLYSLIDHELVRMKKMQERRDAQKITEATIVAPIVQVQKTEAKLPTHSGPSVNPGSQYGNFRNNVFAPVSTKKRYTVTATFEIEVEEKLEMKLEAMLLKKFQEAKFKTTPKILITRGVEDVKTAA